MSSWNFEGKILMKPEEDAIMHKWSSDEYPYEVPKVYLYGYGEEYFPQTSFTWADDSVVFIRGNTVVKYNQSHYTELLAKDEEGKIVWMDGRYAPCSDCWDGVYLGESRSAEQYSIIEYDTDKCEIKKYRVVLEETKKMRDSDFHLLEKFVDLKGVKSKKENYK